MSGKVESDLSKLNAYVRALTDEHVVKVGVFGDKKSRKGTATNAEIGLVHELGSITRKIPARSWLRMPLHVQADQILRQATVGAKELLVQGKLVMVLRRLGVACEAAIQRAFASGGFGQWPEDSPSTRAAKGSSAPLIDSGQLRRAVTSKVDKPS